MKYKALFLDLDGTTIPNKPDGMPSKRVSSAIHKAKPFVSICIATSRPLRMAQPVIEHLDIRGLCLVTDATQIYDPVQKQIVSTIAIEREDLKYATSYLTHRDITCYINTGDNERLHSTALKLPDYVCSVFFEVSNESIADSIIHDLTVRNTLSALKLPSWIKGKACVSITHATATKLHGIVEIAKRLRFDLKEAIGIGDGHNDHPLLSACGLKIAMGNAVPELKAIADFIAPTVDEDGVATVIEKFILAS